MDSLALRERIEVVLKNEEEKVTEIEISLRDILEKIFKKKKLIAVVLIATVLLTYLSIKFFIPFYIPYIGTSKIVLAFNYEGIEKGLDPYGKRFDLNMIKAPVVLSQVVDSLALDKNNITVDDLARSVEIEPIIPGSIVKKIQAIEKVKPTAIADVKAQVLEIGYYPNQFIISLKLKKSYKISERKEQEILGEIIKVYREFFYNKYSDRPSLANLISSFDYTRYDYPDISAVIHTQISIIQSYLSSKGKESAAQEFRSKVTGLTFADIRKAIGVLDEIDLSTMDSLIGSYNLTKDKDKIIKSYEYRIKQRDLTNAKKNDESKIATDMLGKFQKDKTTIMLPGGIGGPLGGTSVGGGSSFVEMQNSGTYYNTLAAEATSAGVEATNALHDASYYKKAIEKLKTDTVSEQEKKVAIGDVLQLVKDITISLNRWIDLTNTTVTEYYETMLYRNAIRELTPVEIYPPFDIGINKLVIYAISAVFGLIIGVFIVLFMSYWEKSAVKISSQGIEV